MDENLSGYDTEEGKDFGLAISIIGLDPRLCLGALMIVKRKIRNSEARAEGQWPFLTGQKAG